MVDGMEISVNTLLKPNSVKFNKKIFRHRPGLKFPAVSSVTHPETGERYYTDSDGIYRYPSVTTVCGLVTRDIINEWENRIGVERANEIKQTAAVRGKRIHSLIEDYVNNKEIEISPFDIKLFKSVQNYLNMMDDIVCQEQAMLSHTLQVGGTTDCVCIFDNDDELSICDYKTSRFSKDINKIEHYFMQTSAYAKMFEEITTIKIKKLVIIMMVDDSDALLFKANTSDWIDKFVAVREQFRSEKGF